MTIAKHEPIQGHFFISKLAQFGWYSGDPLELKGEILDYFHSIHSEPHSAINALILPHAGYRFSGLTAITGIHHIKHKSFSRIIIIGPSHHYSLYNRASTLLINGYQTPLGKITVDKAFVKNLLRSSLFRSENHIHVKEHSVQIFLPLLQVADISAPIVPIIIGQLDHESLSKMVFLLRSLIDSKTLFIISSDFTHYGRNFNFSPFKDSISKNIEMIDYEAINLIKSCDKQRFDSFISATNPTICGKYAIQLFMEMLSTPYRSYLFDYTSSGQLTNNWDHSVSYASIGFSSKWALN